MAEILDEIFPIQKGAGKSDRENDG